MTKTLFFKRKIPLAFCLVILAGSGLDIQAQSVKRQCISSYGAVVTSVNTSVEQTAGQAFSTTTSYNSEVTVLQGFQQPASFEIKTVKTVWPEINLQIYPNPTVYSVTLESEKAIEDAIIRIVNTQGKLVFLRTFSQLNNFEINCSAWDNGIYFISVSDRNNNNSTHKLIINK
jgi:hypothetical protein